ncbi:MAG: lamin tail domain-containing protein [Saprospiraceae bacterium]|nr:lamin tail domain-containing protein [Saprospiraceae bacterium]
MSNYSIEGINLANVLAEPPLFNTVVLAFTERIVPNKIFRLNLLNEGVTDCQGNSTENNNFVEFAVPDVAEPFDVVINEVLFNPNTGGSDFVELYNRSNKIIDVRQFIMASRQGNFIAEAKPVRTGYLLFPQSYVVITPSIENIKSSYHAEIHRHLFKRDLPSYPDQEGTVVVYRAGAQNEVILDEFSYNSDFHHPLLEDQNGVSLERINPEDSTQNRNNWHSAAAAFGFATPSYQNTQFLNRDKSTSSIFTLPYTTISPDSDGFQDFLLLNYQFDEVGFIANTHIYDANGRLVKQLNKGELLAIEGAIKWDGTMMMVKKRE